jgi:ATP-dependent DNA helicase RecQ
VVSDIEADVPLIDAWLGSSPVTIPDGLTDPLHLRLADAVRCWTKQCSISHQHATPLDVTVLLRHVVRRLRRMRVLLPIWLSDEWHLESELKRVDIDVDVWQEGRRSINSRPWRPDWLDCKPGMVDVDEAALAGLPGTERANFVTNSTPLPADRFFREATGFGSYRSQGQLSAVRAAKTMPPGSTLIALLPTGSGKTEVVFSAVRDDCERDTVALIVVPTVALALDLEDRVRKTLAGAWGYGEHALKAPFAWHTGTSQQARDTIRDRITSGQQRFIITSPESLLKSSVGQAIKEIAKVGQLSWFVVDEAHIIKQWGESFRPEFLDLGRFATHLQQSAVVNGKVPCRALLLSATLTDEHIGDLTDQFVGLSPVRLVAANALRPEPELWNSGELPRAERDQRLLEALCHLPSPAIVYATMPAEAEVLVKRLRQEGRTRVASFTGETAGDDRAEILRRFRLDCDPGDGIDVVVATSAFGLGVDYDQVRTVLHACVPETVDRWYQEVGRGGRDGFASVAVLLPATDDIDVALGMGVKHLKVETLKARWASMRRSAVGLTGGKAFRFAMNLDNAVDGVKPGSYNRRWNLQLLRGLQDLNLISWTRMGFEEMLAANLPLDIDGHQAEWAEVHITGDEADLSVGWETWRVEQQAGETARWDTARALAARGASLCSLLMDTFSAGSEVISRHRSAALTFGIIERCGRCPKCRDAGVMVVPHPSPSPVVEWVTAQAASRIPSLPTGVLTIVAKAEDEPDIVRFHAKRGFQLVAAPVEVQTPSELLFRDYEMLRPWATPGCDELLIVGDGFWPTSYLERALTYAQCSHVVVVRDDVVLPVGAPPALMWPVYKSTMGNR